MAKKERQLAADRRRPFANEPFEFTFCDTGEVVHAILPEPESEGESQLDEPVTPEE
jgi:hypothetical protein